MNRIPYRALAAFVLLAGLAAAWTGLRHLPERDVDGWLMLAAQGREPARWQLSAAAHAGHVGAGRALGQYLLGRDTAAERAAGLEWLGRAARAGDTRAALTLGKWHFQGTADTRPDYVQARHWLSRAIPAQPVAHYYLALLDRNGLAGPANPAAARAHLQAAARAGIPHALFLLGNAYLHGEGVPQDEIQARGCFERAAQLEHPGALQALAFAHARGELGYPPDPKEADLYFALAADALRGMPAMP